MPRFIEFGNVLHRFQKLIHFFHSFAEAPGPISPCNVTQIRLFAGDEYFCIFRKFNGDGAVPSSWRLGDVVARTALSCLVLCLLSLSPYHSRRLPVLSPFSLHIPYLPSSPSYDKTLPRLITFIIRPGLPCLPTMLVYFYGEQSEERNSLDKSMLANRWTHQRFHVVNSNRSSPKYFICQCLIIFISFMCIKLEFILRRGNRLRNHLPFIRIYVCFYKFIIVAIITDIITVSSIYLSIKDILKY